MSLLNDVRKSLAGAAGSLAERGQQLSDLAKLQLTMKKLQLERAKRLHELGARTYALYHIEKEIEKTPLPREIHDLCDPIADLDKQMADTQRQIEEVRSSEPEMAATEAVGETSAPISEAMPDELQQRIAGLEEEIAATQQKLKELRAQSGAAATKGQSGAAEASGEPGGINDTIFNNGAQTSPEPSE